MPDRTLPAGDRPGRRLIAAGIIRRGGGRTLRLTATEAGVTGSIRPAVTR
jgi:hypothetical protein